MKFTVLAAITAVVLTTTSASAFEIGATGIQLNNDFVAEYNTGTETFTTTLTPEVRYIPMESVSVYASTELDLQDPAFNGVTIGAEYVPGLGNLDLTTYAKTTTDADFNFDAFVVGVQLSF